MRTLLALAVTSALAWGPGRALAVDTTVITDGTLGDLVDLTDQGADVTISADLGKEADANLFHSFDRFDVGTGGSATFDVGVDNVGPYKNVISRVTGGPSEIDGKIKSNLNEENFFFLNPAGTIFGSGASLDLPGSFHVSTADVLAFESGDDFLTGDGTTMDPALNSAAPAAFGFLAAVPASIQFEGAQLAVNEGMTLSAVGGDVTVFGGSLTAPGGQVQLVSVASPTPPDDPVPLDASQIEVGDYAAGELGTVALTQEAVLDVSSLAPTDDFEPLHGTGRIVIRAGKFLMLGGNLTARSADGNTNAGETTAIDVAVTGEITIDDSGIAGHPAAEILSRAGSAGGTTGDIRLVADSVTLTGGAQVLSENFQPEAPGADIDVDANTVTIKENALVQTSSERNGDAGSLSISGLEVETNAAPDDRAVLITLTDGRVGTVAGITRRESLGRGGLVELTTQTLEVKDGAEIFSVNQEDSAGGGVIDIDATTLKVTDLGLITSQTLGEGRGGDVIIKAGQLEVASQGQITATAGISVDTDVAGRGGDLTIDAGSVAVTGSDGFFTEQISTISYSEDQAQDAGAGGNLLITANSVELEAGGQIRAVTEGDARAGDLSVIARESLLITGAADDGEPSGIFATSGSESGTDATGDAGNILVSAKIVEVDNGGEIGASTWGIGAAGNLQIMATEAVPTIEKVSISGGPTGARSTVAAQGRSGDGGNLTIIADEIEVIDGGEVSVSTTGTGNSGDVVLVARTVLVQGESQADIPEASGVFAKTTSGLADGGNSGSIDITASESVRVRDGGVIAVSSERGGGFAGDIVFRGGGSVEVTDGGQIKAEVLAPITNPLLENASDIRILDADQVIVASEGRVTAETRANGFGGTIAITATDVHLSGNAQITASSTGVDDDSGPAGNIQIAATRNLEITDGSSVTTTAANAGGGNIELQAGDLLYVLDSTVETNVIGDRAEEGENAGDIDIPFAEIEIPEESPFEVASLAPGTPVTPVIPRFVVINRSVIEANANNTDAGNVTIAGVNVIVSSDSVIEATSQTGVDGTVEISSPDADIVSQIAPLQAAFIDASDRLLPPCVARTERTGSFVVQRRGRIPASPDAPLPASLLGSAAGANHSRTVDPGACSTSQGSQ